MRIAVLDTGHAAEAAPSWPTRPARRRRPRRRPDSDGDDYLDPVAGHGTFIGGLIARIAPGCGLMIKRVLSDYGDGDESGHRRRHRGAHRPGPLRPQGAAPAEPVVQRLRARRRRGQMPAQRHPRRPWPRASWWWRRPATTASAGAPTRRRSTASSASPPSATTARPRSATGARGCGPARPASTWRRRSTTYTWAEEREAYGVDPDLFDRLRALVGHVVRRAGGGRRAGPHDDGPEGLTGQRAPSRRSSTRPVCTACAATARSSTPSPCVRSAHEHHRAPDPAPRSPPTGAGVDRRAARSRSSGPWPATSRRGANSSTASPVSCGRCSTPTT